MVSRAAHNYIYLLTEQQRDGDTLYGFTQIDYVFANLTADGEDELKVIDIYDKRENLYESMHAFQLTSVMDCYLVKISSENASQV